MVVGLRHGVLGWGVVRAVMRQAAYAVARRHIRTGGAGQKRQGRAQQHNNNKNGLCTTHRSQSNTTLQKSIRLARNSLLSGPVTVLRQPKQSESRSSDLPEIQQA
jgi:hypothetical protein